MRTVLIDMPCDCRGCVVENSDGEHCIVLNSRMSHEMNIKSYIHELRHIKNGDLRSCEDVNVVESYCHEAE